MDDEFRELTLEEANQIRASFDAGTGESTAPVIDPLRLGRRIWQLALAGNNRDQIAERTKISVELLDETLNAYRLRLGLSVDHYRALDNERVEKLVTYWLPVATAGPLKILRITKEGNPIIEEDFDRPLKASQFVLGAIERRVKILGATHELGGAPGFPGGQNEGAKAYTERNIVIWLREVMPSIERITRELEAQP
jgi:hypothetical protein